MAHTVAEILVEMLQEIGVRQIFGLIGDSLNPLADAVSRSTIEWIGVRHEEGAALAAAGQAKLTGRLGVCAGTTGPGSTHLVAGLYEAARDHAPVLAISGDMPRKFQGLDYIQTTRPDLLFRDVSLYSETLATPENAPELIHQAIASAYSGRGVAHLTIPQEIMGQTTRGRIGSLETLKPRSEFPASDEEVADIVRKIESANRIVIMCGAGCRGLSEELSELSDRLKAPLIHSVKGKDIQSYHSPHWMGGIGMIGTRATWHAAIHSNLFVMVGTDYPYSEFLPDHGNVIQIDERPEVLGRRTPTLLGVMGSARPVLRKMLELITPKSDRRFFDEVSAERMKWDKILDEQASILRSKDLIHPQAVARLVGNLADPEAVFVLDTGLNTLWSGNWIQQNGMQRIIGSFNNAAVGTALGQANGIQALDRKRQVIALCGDGGFNMLMGEFMTAVHHNLPVKVIIYNNSSFGLIRLEAESVGLAPFKAGIEFPNPDFAAFAAACGAQGVTVRAPDELEEGIRSVLASEGPAILNAVVNAYELPNVPHVTAGLLGKVTLAKIKEAVQLVAGS